MPISIAIHRRLCLFGVSFWPAAAVLLTARPSQAEPPPVGGAYKPPAPIVQDLADSLPASFHGDVFGIEVWQYLALGLIVLLGLIVRMVIQVVVASRVRKLAEVLGQRWASTLVHVFASPGATLVMALMLRVGYPELGLPQGARLVTALAVRVMLVLAFVWAAYRGVDFLGARMASKAQQTESKLDDQLVPLVRKTLKIIVVVAGALFILQNLNVDVGSLLAGLGLGGLAFALAAKDTLANFFGSITIFVDRPFQIGDWVVVKGVEGIVEEVGFRSTRIRTFYNSLVSVPNHVFTEVHIDNYGAREYRRTFTTLNLSYDTTPEQLQAFVEGVRAIIVANEFTRKDYYEVHFSAFGSHSLDVMLYFFFKVSSWSEELQQRHNVFLEIARLAHELGVQFAFPTQTLHLDYVNQPGAPRDIPQAQQPGSMAEVVKSFASGGSRARPSGPTIVPGAYLVGAHRAGPDGNN